MQWLAAPGGKPGWNKAVSDAAIQFCLTIKCLFNSPLRQALDWFNCNRVWRVCLGQRRTKVPCAADKRGWRFRCTTVQAATACICSLTPQASSSWESQVAWRRRQWRKVRLGIDAQTLQIRAIVVAANEVGDSPVEAEPLGQISVPVEVARFKGDDAYYAQHLHRACHGRCAIPIIPPRKGARLRKGLDFTHRNEAV